jgi:phosphatidylserine/phosphatidylglycerophosphate/cardiolipin synthase-like enzyme
MLEPDRRKPGLLVLLIFLVFLTIAVLGASGPGELGVAPVRAQALPPPAPLVGPGIAVYFTDPTLDAFRGGPETEMLRAIDAARARLDVAAYDLNLWGLRDALIAAHRRGVSVRVVVEADALDRPEVQALIAAGIPLAADRADGLMHQKFVVIDRRQVWAGSMNFTLNGAYRNDNNLLALTGPEAAAVYEAEFEEMFVDGLFGAYSPAGTGTALEVAGPDGRRIPVEFLFSPDDGARDRIVALLEGTQESVRFMAFSFTSDEIGDALLELATAGIDVRGVFDESQLRSNTGSEYEWLLGAGLDVRIDGSPDKLHHKVIIIDGEIVITGSYNFSVSAETRNDENVVIVFDEEVAGVFLEEWERVFALGR